MFALQDAQLLAKEQDLKVLVVLGVTPQPNEIEQHGPSMCQKKENHDCASCRECAQRQPRKRKRTRWRLRLPYNGLGRIFRTLRAAAKRFFKQALEVVEQAPDRVTTDGHDTYPRAIGETIGENVTHRCNPYLNKRIEQDHRGIKQRYYPMRGFTQGVPDFDAASRFCRAFDAQRHYVRMRPTMGEGVPPLSDQRRAYCARFQTLMGELVAA